MSDLPKQFERQAQRQRQRAHLSWPEKVRQAELMREAVMQLRKERPAKIMEPPKANSAAGGLPRA